MTGVSRQRGKIGRQAVLLALALSLPARVLWAQGAPVDHSREYRACMHLVALDPEEAFEGALAWQSEGGGEPARHCAAAALIGLGHYEEAARRLEALAQGMTAAAPSLRAGVLGQAGQAWHMAGKATRAHAVQSAALQLDPDNVEILADRGITLAGATSYWEAVDDLNRALELAPRRADLLVLRAAAYRFLDALELAGDDIERALKIDPANADGLLERGILHRLKGEDAPAREDWIKVLSLVPQGPTAEAARANLEKLDVKVE
jgi:tetratricopeptide (TPR) repeat protein